MSLFNFFRRRKPVLSESNSDTVVADPVQMVNQQLFVDENPPLTESGSAKTVNAIEAFLDQNFEWQGYSEGYAHPETEYLDSKLKVLRSDFRLAVDKCMDARRTELGEVKMHLIDTEGISTRLEAKLKEKISQLEVTIHELDTQKILSLENEGFISGAAHAYRLGFIKGLERYQMEKLFAGSTGLFNQ